MSFPRYPKYKASGVEWLGEVPEHWEVKPLNAVASHNDDVLDETTDPETEIAYVDISSVDTTSGIHTKDVMRFSAAPSRARRRVKHGDVIVSTVRTYLRAIAMIRAPEENLVVSTGFAVVRSRGAINADFVGFALSASFFIEQVIARSTGVSYPAINASELVAIPVTVPPLAEQLAIAAFLDRETAKIDELVEAQARLIELLKEKRQAVISHAVTKGLNPHAPMKPSGVEWLGEVPEGWEVKPLKAVASHNDDVLDETTDPETEIAYVDISSVDTTSGIHTKDVMRFSAAPSRARRRVKHGDVIVSTVRTYLRAIAMIRAPEENLVVSTGFAVVRSRGALNADFVGFALSASFFIEQVIARSTGVSYPAINASELVAIPVTIPPLTEQLAIAAFLDRETAKIDELVEAQARLIELLKEKRQAVISHAVTKGLNPHAPMKPSGIEWLGEVPEGWEVRRLKSIVEEPLKYGANESAELDDRTLPRFVRITDIDDSGALRDETFKSLPVEVAEPFLLREGDVLLARSGATVGKSFIYSNQWGPACFAGYLIRARLRHTVCLAQWLYYFCQTNGYWGYVIGSQIQATIQNVSAEKYANLYLAVPSIAEQTAIIEFLATELAKFDTLIAESERAIDLLRERRSALISAAVTGQIDVRNAVTLEVA